MKTRSFITGIAALAFFLFFCQEGVIAQKNIAANYVYKTECMGVELDGSQTVKAWGFGRNRTDASEQARKNAVRDVLFNGISSGRAECNVKPVIFEVNAQENHQDFFNSFFADRGPYTRFVTDADQSRYHVEVIKERKKAGSQKMYGLILRVLRQDLIREMKTQGILK